MTRLPMDSSVLNPTWTLEPPQMSVKENFQEVSAASLPVSEVFIKKLSNSPLNSSNKFSSLLPKSPPQWDGQKLSEGIFYRRRRMRTLLTAQKERIERMIQIMK